LGKIFNAFSWSFEMRIGKLVRCAVVSLATVGVCVPQLAFAQTTTPPAPAVVDIAMADGGTLHGQVVDLRGGSVAAMPVSVRAQNQEIARATTTSEGQFAVQGLRGGVYQVAAGEGQGVYRLWTADAAPPSAQKGAIVYTQNPGESSGTFKMLLTNPIVIAGLVATAIAVPVALANAHHSSSP
jgi:hypothetical protein